MGNRVFILIFFILSSFSLNAKELKMYACGVTRVAFIKELNKAFEKSHNVKIILNERGGDRFVLKGLSSGEVEIGSGCRDILESEKGVWATQVAWGALSFIVNPKNKIDNISTEDIKKILTGEITNWKELGGEDREIHLIVRDGNSSGIGLTARELLFNDLNKTFSKKAKVVDSSSFVREAIAIDENAFGIDNIISSSKDKSIKMLKVDGVEPTKENILSGKYKMRQALYLYLRDKEHNSLAKKYIDFALSDEGQKIISESGTANLEEANAKGDEDNFLLQNLQFQLKSR
jgi:phosphate transport system substrate-binding protein